MQNAYSYLGSPIHLLLKDEIAEGYNRYIDTFRAAELKFKELNGHDHTPFDEPLRLNYSAEDRNAYDKVLSVINLLIEINDGELDIPESQLSSNNLIRI